MTVASPGPAYRIEADPENGRIAFFNSEVVSKTGRRISLGPVGDEPLERVQPPSSDADVMARILSVGSWTRIFSRWSLDPGTSPTHTLGSIADPVAAQVTDKAIYFRTRDFDVPEADGIYTYTTHWDNGKGWSVTDTLVFVVSGDAVVVKSKVNDGLFHVEFSGPKSVYDRAAIISGLALSGNAWEPPGWPVEVVEWNGVRKLAPLSDDELGSVVGTWTLHQNFNGVESDVGEFDLRMMALKNLQVAPASFDPTQPDNNSSQLRCELRTLPGPTEVFPQGWRPVSPVDWRVWITDSQARPVRTLSGQIAVGQPDATGKVGVINVTWDGKLEDGSLAPRGTYPFEVRALGNLTTLGNGLTRPSTGVFKIGNQELNIANAAANPPDFDPTAGGSTTLGFVLSTEGLGNSPEINWTVSVVETGTNNTLHSFPVSPGAHGPGQVVLQSGTSLRVDLAWDGRHDGTPIPAEFTWVISANARMTGGGGNPVVAETRIANQNDRLTVIEIRADNAIPFLDPDGNLVADPALYFSEATGPGHELVLAGNAGASSSASTGTTAQEPPIAAKADSTVIKEFEITLRSNPGGSYEVRLVDPDEPTHVLSAETPVSFAGTSQVSVRMVANLGTKVHVFRYLKLQYRKKFQTLPPGDWRDPIQVGKEKVYFSPIGPPLMPFSDKERLGSAAKKLAYELAEGSQNEAEVRANVAQRLGPWLKSRDFVYTPGIQRYSQTPTPFGVASGHTFKFGKFISPSPSKDFSGDCHEVSDTAVVACAAVGVELDLLPFLAGKLPPQKIQVGNHPPVTFDSAGMLTNYLLPHANRLGYTNLDNPQAPMVYVPVSLQIFEFPEHQTTYFGGQVWETLADVSLTATGPPRSLFNLGMNDYFDSFIATQQSFKVVIPRPSQWVTFSPYPDPKSQAALRLTKIIQ